MTLLTPDSGQESDEFLTDCDERYAVNEVCKQILRAWELSEDPCDIADLVRQMNHGAGRAVRKVRELKKFKSPA